jgi:diaminopimelate decarboxylase
MEEHCGLPAWQVPGYLETHGGHLMVDAVDAERLAENHGTPLYVFSEKRIADNIRNLRSALSRSTASKDLLRIKS